MARHFTRDEVEELRKMLAILAVKDSELPELESLTDDSLISVSVAGVSYSATIGQLRSEISVIVDAEPTKGSTNAVSSGGVFDAEERLSDRIGDLDTVVSGKYTKPAGGIPEDDLAAAVQTSLGKADTALQEHQSLDGYVQTINGDGPDEEGNVVVDSPFKTGSKAHSAQLGDANTADSEFSTANGVRSYAGMTGYYWNFIKRVGDGGIIYLTKRNTELLEEEPEVDEEFENPYSVGDVFSLHDDANFYNLGKITAIDYNKVTVDNLVHGDSSFGEIPFKDATDDKKYYFYVLAKPDAGEIDFGIAASAEGYETKALNLGAHSEGCETEAYGRYSHTEGHATKAGFTAHAEGRETSASGKYSHAEGQATIASGKHAHAEGWGTIASGDRSHAEGARNLDGNGATGTYSHSEGLNTLASGSASHAEGSKTIASGTYSHAEGYSNESSGPDSHAEGSQTEASGKYAHSEGLKSKAGGEEAHAEGSTTTASANASHAEGATTTASNTASHAEGLKTTASGSYSHSEGDNTNSLGRASHAEGRGTVAGNETRPSKITDETIGHYTHAEGLSTFAKGASSHAEGLFTQALGGASHAEGYNTNANANLSHAEGEESIAYSQTCHAEGHRTVAGNGTRPGKFVTTTAGYCAHAEGGCTHAKGTYSHAEGFYTQSSGKYSHAEGQENIAQNDGEHAEGNYGVSISGKTIHTVGIGDSSTARKNAHTITTDGKHYIPGVGGYTGEEKTATLLNSKQDLATVINSLPTIVEVTYTYNGMDYDCTALSATQGAKAVSGGYFAVRLVKDVSSEETAPATILAFNYADENNAYFMAFDPGAGAATLQVIINADGIVTAY